MRHSVAELAICARGYLDDYCNSRSNFAFWTYDRWYGSPDTLTPLDCLAANLLSMRLGHRRIIPLFHETDSPETRLRAAMQDVLDATQAQDVAFHKLSTTVEWPSSLVLAAVDATADVYGWRGITVTKVLHRLRPHLVPLVDSVVQRFYGQLSFPGIFTAIHQDGVANGELLAELVDGRTTPDGRPLSRLRALDSVVWCHERVGCETPALGSSHQIRTRPE
jgi:hypothetical protein